MQLKKTLIVFALLAIFLSIGVYTTTSFQKTVRPTQTKEIACWQVFSINETTTDGGGGDDVPGGGIPK
jgi:hypothetical protein